MRVDPRPWGEHGAGQTPAWPRGPEPRLGLRPQCCAPRARGGRWPVPPPGACPLLPDWHRSGLVFSGTPWPTLSGPSKRRLGGIGEGGVGVCPAVAGPRGRGRRGPSWRPPRVASRSVLAAGASLQHGSRASQAAERRSRTGPRKARRTPGLPGSKKERASHLPTGFVGCDLKLPGPHVTAEEEAQPETCPRSHSFQFIGDWSWHPAPVLTPLALASTCGRSRTPGLPLEEGPGRTACRKRCPEAGPRWLPGGLAQGTPSSSACWESHVPSAVSASEAPA